MTRPPDADLPDRSSELPSAVVASIWRHPLLVLGGMALGLGLALGLTTMQPAVFQAESRVFLSSHEEFDPTGQREQPRCRGRAADRDVLSPTDLQYTRKQAAVNQS